MTMPIAPGAPDYGSSGSSKFIPEVWSSRIIEKFYDACVLGDIANHDFEGEIKEQGDKVIIRGTPNITVRRYARGGKIIREKPVVPAIEFTVDYASYFAVEVDDIDKAQSDLALLDKWTAAAAQDLTVDTDTVVLGSFYADAAAANKGQTAGRKSTSYDMGATGFAVQVTKANVLDHIVNMASVLDEQNALKDGRWAVVPVWFMNVLQLSDLKNAAFNANGAVEIQKNGRIGSYAGMMLYASNNVATASDTGTKYHVPFGQKYGLSFAAQLTKTRNLELQDTFASSVEGLNVYGFKVVKPEAIGELYCYK